MKIKNKLVIAGVFTGALAVGLGVGVAVAPTLGLGNAAQAAETVTSDDSAARQAELEEVAGPLEVNANGETYGSMLGREGTEEQPDLIEVYGNSGEIGYVKAEDLIEPVPANPQEAAKLSAAARTAGDREIPVYASDGVTQTDTFTIQAPTVVEK